MLRTNMQYVSIDADKFVCTVTSALPDEGKSTVAISLAISLALADRRVALIECDLRRPRTAKRLGLDGSTGTTSVLVGHVSLEDALQTYRDTNLQVLVAGPIPPNPAELLQSASMEKLLRDLRNAFDVVILDSPPLLPVTDAAILTAAADGAILVVRHAHTTRDQLTHAIDRLDAVDAKALGIVVNRSPAKWVGKGYGYGYGYYDDPSLVTVTGSTEPARRRRGTLKWRS